MSSSCRFQQTTLSVVRVAGSLMLLTLLLAGCSKQKPAAVEEDWSLDPGSSVKAAVTAGGIEAEYTAHFDDERVVRINEVRKPGSGDRRTGEYVFEGARLIRYRGAALLDTHSIEIKFDMQGKVTAATAASDAEIAAIRNRASLLRSLALTKRTTQLHGG